MEDGNLEKLNPRHQQIARLYVGGHSQAEIARLLKINRSTVCRTVKDPQFKEEVARLQQMADVNATASVPGIPQKLGEGAHVATEVLMSILEDDRQEVDMLKLKANVALEILNRAGYGAVKQVHVEQRSIGIELTKEEAEELRRRAKEAGFIVQEDLETESYETDC